MRWEQTPNNSGNGSKTRRSSCNLLLLPKESGAQGQAEIQQGAAPVEEQAPAPGLAQEAVRKVPALAGEREAAPEAGSVPVPVLVPERARVEVVMLQSGMAVGRAQQRCCAITAAGAVHPSREVGWGKSAGSLRAAGGSVSRKRTSALCSASSHSSAGPAKTPKPSWTP